jgi:hypothetical protein
MDATMAALPGLSGLRIFADAVAQAEDRARTPSPAARPGQLANGS